MTDRARGPGPGSAGRIESPPRLAEWFLRICLRRGPVGASILGDLREEYAARSTGRFREFWYVWTALSLGIGYMAAAVARAASRMLVGRLHARELHSRRRRVRDGIRFELRMALRGLLRRPAYTVTAVVTFALGIGASTAIFAVVYGALFRPLPYPDGDRLVRIGERPLSSPPTSFSSASIPNFITLREGARLYASIDAFAYAQYNVTGDPGPERVLGMWVTPGFFGTLGVRPVLGRDFATDDDPGSVVALSDALWREHFGEDRSIVGRTIVVDRTVRTVIGVLPASVSLPAEPRLFAPFVWDAGALGTRNRRGIDIVGRLRPGVSVEQGRAELESIFARIAVSHPVENERRTVAVGAFSGWMIGGSRRMLGLFAGATLVVLLIACVNVANLGIARVHDRRHEFAVRAALGAGRRRLMHHLLTENLVLALSGGLFGVLVSVWATRLLVALFGRSIPRASEIGLDAGVLLFALSLSVATGLLVGLFPAAHVRSHGLHDGLRAGSRGNVGGGSRVRHGLVVAEVALAVLLACGAGLLINTVWRLARIDLGVVERGALVFGIGLPEAAYRSLASITGFHTALAERIGRLPGVEAVGATTRRPLSGGTNGDLVVGDAAGEPQLVEMREVTPGYFEAVGMRVIDGRGLVETDFLNGSRAVIVNETLARSYFRDRPAVGARIAGTDGDESWEIAGVISDVADFGPQRAPAPTAYWPYGQGALSTSSPFRFMNVVVRAAGDAIAVLPAVREAVRSLDADLPIYDVARLADLAARAIGDQRRSTTVLLTVLAALAIALGAIGIYGLVAYAVSQRMREMGLRLVLGATSASNVQLVVAHGIRLAIAGVAIGLGLAAIAGRLLDSLLYDVAPADPFTLAVAGATLLVVAVLASALPALRAASARPADTLREMSG